MDKVSSYTANHHDTIAALALLAEQLQNPDNGNGLVITFYGCDHNGILIDAFLQENFSDKAIIGGSSSGGLITESGFHDQDTIRLLVLDDEAGDYGVADGVFDDDDPEQLAERVLTQALDNCDCTGQLPELIWLYQTPGHEEAVMRGLRNVVGDHCPIIGGTAADNDVSGQWHLLGPRGVIKNGLVIAVMFPSSPIGFAFQGGYEPSDPQGTITGIGYHSAGESGVVSDGAGRDVLTIDGAAGERNVQRIVREMGGFESLSLK
ncbi:FIST N-terminal domain-containing protein [Agrobacterium sp.]|uniref:FIST N-terminal domain-containing protein n=1 Tax=Agrobacterium sp. TaxID=361 RepID=UPI0028AFF7DE|nr:FIST N-terminal domain-containing protein [Agrobacterium sp.]